MPPAQLLARLLVASSVAGACASSPSGEPIQAAPAASVQLLDSPGPSSTAPPPRPASSQARDPRAPLQPRTPDVKPGWHAVRPAEPPLTSQHVPLRFTAADRQAGDKGFEECSDKFYAWPDNRSGGPFFSSHCYERPSPGDNCLAATDPKLRRALDLRNGADCVADGPYEQLSAESDAPLCCYNTGWFGSGRP